MARTDTYYGLNKWARKALAKTLPGAVKSTVTYASGRTKVRRQENIPAVVKVEVLGYIEGFEDSPLIQPLKSYTMHDGRILDEYVQYHICSGGPCYWIALKNRRTGKVLKSSIWTHKDIYGY